jgi:spore coat protein CotH
MPALNKLTSSNGAVKDEDEETGTFKDKMKLSDMNQVILGMMDDNLNDLRKQTSSQGNSPTRLVPRIDPPSTV